jgi:uncharacterized protein YaaQ
MTREMVRKMVMAVVSRDQADRVLDKLISAGYGATFTESRGGMLRQAQQMIFVAVESDRVDDVISTIRETCHAEIEVRERQSSALGRSLTDRPATIAEVGYAVIFVWDLEHFETI